jgi:hypothetical protein
MVNIYSLAVDPKLEVNGVDTTWFGITFKIARMGNPKYDEEIIRLSIEAASELGVSEENLPLDKLNEIVKKAASKFILVGWENMEDENGDPIPYSHEKALEFFNDVQLKDMYKFIIGSSKIMEKYRRSKVRGSAKNLKSSSTGKKSGQARTRRS